MEGKGILSEYTLVFVDSTFNNVTVDTDCFLIHIEMDSEWQNEG